MRYFQNAETMVNEILDSTYMSVRGISYIPYANRVNLRGIVE